MKTNQTLIILILIAQAAGLIMNTLTIAELREKVVDNQVFIAQSVESLKELTEFFTLPCYEEPKEKPI